MIKFIDNIICCFIANVLALEEIIYEGPFAGFNETNKHLVQKLYNDSNVIISETQIYLFFTM